LCWLLSSLPRPDRHHQQQCRYESACLHIEASNVIQSSQIIGSRFLSHRYFTRVPGLVIVSKSLDEKSSFFPSNHGAWSAINVAL
jgi:hypothetical protein